MGLKTAGGWLLFSSRTLSSRSFPSTGRALPQSNLTDEKSPEKTFNKSLSRVHCTFRRLPLSLSLVTLSFPLFGLSPFLPSLDCLKGKRLVALRSKENRSLCGLYSAVMGRVHFLPVQVEYGPSTSMSLSGRKKFFQVWFFKKSYTYWVLDF